MTFEQKFSGPYTKNKKTGSSLYSKNKRGSNGPFQKRAQSQIIHSHVVDSASDPQKKS